MTNRPEIILETGRHAKRMEAELRAVLQGELDGLPLYIVLQSEMPYGTITDECSGMVFHELSALARRFVGDRWTGQGPAIYVADLELAKEAGLIEDVAAIVNGLAAHEAAHVVQFLHEGAYDNEADKGEVEQAAADVRKPIEIHTNLDAPPWEEQDHGPDFLRIALHIAHRLKKRGHYCPPSRVFAAEGAGLDTSAGHFNAVLHEEFEAAEGLSLFEVLARAPPEEYAALWKRETHEYYELIPWLKATKMISFFETLRATVRRKEAANVTTFQKLAIQIADGKQPNAEKVVELLRDAGKSLDDLQQAAELIVVRRKHAATIAQAKGAEDRQKRIVAEIEAADKVLATAETAHEERCGPLRLELIQIDNEVRAAEHARRELEKTATDPVLRAKADGLHREIHEVCTRKQDRQRHIEFELTGRRNDARNKADAQSGGIFATEEARAAYSRELSHWECRIAEVTEEIRQLCEREKELRALEAEVLKELLDPNCV